MSDNAFSSRLISINLPSLQKYNESETRKKGDRKRFIEQAREDEKNGCVNLHIISIYPDERVTIQPAGVAE